MKVTITPAQPEPATADALANAPALESPAAGSSSVESDFAVADEQARSRAEPARALVIEGGLLATGLALAHLLAGSGFLSLALAVWGFFLVQSLYFLMGGVGRRAEREEAIDPFERAHQQAVRLMDDFAL